MCPQVARQSLSSQTQCWRSYCTRGKVPPSSILPHCTIIKHGITYPGLDSYIKEIRTNSLVAPGFKLTDLVNLYHARLEQLGTKHTSGRIHSTKLKNRILSYFPDMDAHKRGCDVVLIFAMRILALHWKKHVRVIQTWTQFI